MSQLQITSPQRSTADATSSPTMSGRNAMRPAVDGLRVAEEEAGQVEQVAADIRQRQLLQGFNRLVFEDEWLVKDELDRARNGVPISPESITFFSARIGGCQR